jgi:hypothetical protein
VLRFAHEVRCAEDLRCQGHVPHTDKVNHCVARMVARHPHVESARVCRVRAAVCAGMVSDWVLHVGPVVAEVS